MLPKTQPQPEKWHDLDGFEGLGETQDVGWGGCFEQRNTGKIGKNECGVIWVGDRLIIRDIIIRTYI